MRKTTEWLPPLVQHFSFTNRPAILFWTLVSQFSGESALASFLSIINGPQLSFARFYDVLISFWLGVGGLSPQLRHRMLVCVLFTFGHRRSVSLVLRINALFYALYWLAGKLFDQTLAVLQPNLISQLRFPSLMNIFCRALMQSVT